MTDKLTFSSHKTPSALQMASNRSFSTAAMIGLKRNFAQRDVIGSMMRVT